MPWISKKMWERVEVGLQNLHQRGIWADRTRDEFNSLIARLGIEPFSREADGQRHFTPVNAGSRMHPLDQMATKGDLKRLMDALNLEEVKKPASIVIQQKGEGG